MEKYDYEIRQDKLGINIYLNGYCVLILHKHKFNKESKHASKPRLTLFKNLESTGLPVTKQGYIKTRLFK